VNNLIDFTRLFDRSNSKRDKFLSRLLGLFSEDIVRIWARDPLSPYEDLGRPTVIDLSVQKSSVMDFMLRHKDTGALFVTEMKCWPEYEGYRWLKLAASAGVLEKLKEPAAFVRFLAMARDLDRKFYAVRVQGKSVEWSGCILVWCSADEHEVIFAREQYLFHDVLSLDHIITDLIIWQNEEYKQFLQEREAWCLYLFAGLQNEYR
jgi:hypothetical protein